LLSNKFSIVEQIAYQAVGIKNFNYLKNPALKFLVVFKLLCYGEATIDVEMSDKI